MLPLDLVESKDISTPINRAISRPGGAMHGLREHYHDCYVLCVTLFSRLQATQLRVSGECPTIASCYNYRIG